VGVVDLLTKTTEGIRNTAAYLDESKRHRIRWPRYFALPPVLQAYDQDKSIGQTLLKVIDEGSYAHQQYRFHMRIAEENWVLMSHAQLFLLSGPNVYSLRLTR
jgi:vacuolar protein sorting-associated protein 13A/C